MWRNHVSAIRCWNWRYLLLLQAPCLSLVALKVVTFIFLDLLPVARQLPSRWQVLSAVVEVSMVISVSGGLPTTPLRGTAAAHCDNLLCLDEIGQASSRVVSEVAYMLANGQGKARANKEGNAKAIQGVAVVLHVHGRADACGQDRGRRTRASYGRTGRPGAGHPCGRRNWTRHFYLYSQWTEWEQLQPTVGWSCRTVLWNGTSEIPRTSCRWA